MNDLSCHLNCDLSALERRTLCSDYLMEAKAMLRLLWHGLPQFIQFSRDLQSAECPTVVSTGNQVSFIAVNKKTARFVYISNEPRDQKTGNCLVEGIM